MPSDISSRELLEQFEAATLPGECFHHAEHVRVVFLYLIRYPVLQALEKFTLGLKRLASTLGKPRLYHQTITWAYVFLIHERMARSPEIRNWEEFALKNPDLLIWRDGVVQQYYSPEILSSPLARAVFVFPDRIPASRLEPSP